MNRRTFLRVLGGAVVGAAIAPSVLIEPSPRVLSREEKIAMLQRLLEHAIESHDRLIEEAIFTQSRLDGLVFDRNLQIASFSGGGFTLNWRSLNG